jgi:hypothetical protein
MDAVFPVNWVGLGTLGTLISLMATHARVTAQVTKPDSIGPSIIKSPLIHPAERASTLLMRGALYSSGAIPV